MSGLPHPPRDGTDGAHRHAYPLQPPEGSYLNPGPCRICGKPWERDDRQPADDDVRAVGTVECDHGAPLTVGVYRGQVNIAGRMLGEAACEEFSQYFVRAQWMAARDRAGTP